MTETQPSQSNYNRRQITLLVRDSLRAVTEAGLRCWFLFVAAMLLGFIFAFVPQTREALFAQPIPSLATWGFYCLVGAQAMYLAMVLVDKTTKKTQEYSKLYASHLVPGVVGITILLVIPGFLESYLNSVTLPEEREGGLRFFILFLKLAAVAIPLARFLVWFQKGEKTKTDDDMKVFVAISAYVVVCGIAFVLTSSAVALGVCAIIALAVSDIWTWPIGTRRYERRIGSFIMVLYALLLLGLCLWICASPARRISWIGFSPIETILLVVSTWLGVGLMATLLFRQIGLFFATICVAVVIGRFVTGPFDVETVRTFQYKEIRIAPRRLTLKEHTAKWLAERLQRHPEDQRMPVFIVTADGGGIRAACWTAISLGALEDANSSLAYHTFGISSVSGGSLGAVIFAALVKEQAAGRIEFEYVDGRGPIETRASEVLSHDFLSPALMSMLVPDVFRTVSRTSWFQNRGAALETSFEVGWQAKLGTDDLSKPFQQLWRGKTASSVPALFLNGTRPDTGERLLLSHVVLEDSGIDAIDIQSYLGDRDVRASTAVMMSARFPGISPTGRIMGSPKDNDTRNPTGYLDVVDGGYYDNTGTATAADLLRVLLDVAEEKNVLHRIVPVLLMVPNSPRPADLQRKIVDETPRDSGVLGAVVSPVGTLDQIRAGVGSRFRAELVEAVKAANGVVLEFPLLEAEVDFPLGWMLAEETREAMHEQVASWKRDSKSDFAIAIQLLKGPPGGPK